MKGCVLRCLWVPIKGQVSCLDYCKLWLIGINIKHRGGSLCNGFCKQAHKHTNMLWAQPPWMSSMPKTIRASYSSSIHQQAICFKCPQVLLLFSVNPHSVCAEKGNKESCVLAAWASTSHLIWEKHQLEEARQKVSGVKRRGGVQDLGMCKHASYSRSQTLPLDSCHMVLRGLYVQE